MERSWGWSWKEYRRNRFRITGNMKLIERKAPIVLWSPFVSRGKGGCISIFTTKRSPFSQMIILTICAVILKPCTRILPGKEDIVELSLGRIFRGSYLLPGREGVFSLCGMFKRPFQGA